MTHNYENITTLLPQKEPMIFVDSVEEIRLDGPEGTLGATSLFTVRDDHIMVTPTGFPVTGLLENVAQTIGIFAGARWAQRGEKPKMGLLLGARKAECTRSFLPVGATIRTKVTDILQSQEGLWQFQAEVYWVQENEKIVQFSINVFQPPQETRIFQLIE